MTLFSRLFRRDSTANLPVKRALDPETGDPIPYALPTRQMMQGKLTYFGLVLTAIGAVGKLFGWEFPTDEAQGILGWLGANWDSLAQLVGLITGFYGRARVEWRKHHPSAS